MLSILYKLQSIFKGSSFDFEEIALDIFNFQAKNNHIYQKYIHFLGIKPSEVKSIQKIPFLPIDFFKRHSIISIPQKAEVVFESSGTSTVKVRSRHYVVDVALYEQSFFAGFNLFYGNPEEYCFLCLLPAYLERKGSSLVYMAQKLIEKSKTKHSGFFLFNFDELHKKLQILEQNNQKTILLGVSFALLDFAEKYPQNLQNTIVMETGGMKGRKKEQLKTEMHQQLKKQLGVQTIHSEYGMTELLSQAYSKGKGKYFVPPWMKILIRDVYDPFCYVQNQKSGGINIIDFANLYSCSFIETSDLGKQYADNSFEIIGRLDNRDIRGCNLMFNG